MSLKQSVSKHGNRATDALKTELKQLLDQQVFQYVLSTNSKQPLRSITVFADKFNTVGDLVQVKVRLVADGSSQNLELWESSSPTASLLSTKLFLKAAAANQEDIKVFDIKGAYLHAKMDTEIYLRFNADITQQLRVLDPSCLAFVQKDGSLNVRLLKALYGYEQSGRLWNERLNSFL